MLKLRGLAPVAALAVTGCMASKADVLLLQDEIRTLRAMQARSDSASRAQADTILLLTLRSNEPVRDSLRAFSQRFGAFQANVSGELFEIGKQLIELQQRAGLSAKTIMDMRAALDERAQSQAASATVGAEPAAGAPPPPSAAQLFTASFDLLRRLSYGAARAGFEELLRKYPDFDQASAAQLYIAQSYQEERRTTEADSVYSLVVSKYPRSQDAPTALYKWGMSQVRQGRLTEAKAALQRLQRDYPRSTEAELATETLKQIK